MSYLAGQQLSTSQTIGNKASSKPSLILSIPTSTSQLTGILEVNLGLPFTPSPLSLTFAVSPKAPNPLTSIFFDWADSPVDKDEEEDAQVITIAPGNPFYRPPSSPMTPETSGWKTFACDALAESSKKTPAQLFHEGLERIIRLNDQAIILDVEGLQEMELLSTPVQVFSELSMGSMQTKSISPPLTPVHWRGLPDVPQDFDLVSYPDLEEMVEDLEDEDEDYSSEEAITPQPHAAAFTALLDKRLVAPLDYEDYPSNPIRWSVPLKPIYAEYFPK